MGRQASVDVLKRTIFPLGFGDGIPIPLTSSQWRHPYIAYAVPEQNSSSSYFLILNLKVAVIESVLQCLRVPNLRNNIKILY